MNDTRNLILSALFREPEFKPSTLAPTYPLARELVAANARGD